MTAWLEVVRGAAPLIVSFPHTGADIPRDIEERLVSPWLARKDADWWLHKLYDFAAALGATTIRTAISRTVIDVNRDPSGASLYPGQATTELCPTTTFDGEPLYRSNKSPDAAEIEARKTKWFVPYHTAVEEELRRLKTRHGGVVLYDAHSIRSHVSRLFEGELAHFNIGTNSGKSCDRALTDNVERTCDAAPFSHVTNGRFKGGWTTRHYGKPEQDIHAIQMELACRGYMDEPAHMDESNWPSPYDAAKAAPMQAVLRKIIEACLRFGNG